MGLLEGRRALQYQLKQIKLRGMRMEQITVTSPSHTEQSSASHIAVILSTHIVREPSMVYYVSKRLLDIMLSALGIVFLLPVLLIIMLCIKFDDGGQLFHFREIIGLHGRRFRALKFRTMIPNADIYLAQHPELLRKFQQNMKLERDPRITRIGHFLRKTSLDELPQLFNVLVGQMSLVGPRMIHPSELPRYGEWATKRLAVRPGITGLWQISGRQRTSYEERIMYDMRYIDSRSCINDMVILVKTPKVLFKPTGV